MNADVREAHSLRRTAAWRISLWSTVAFAIGTAIVFVFLQHFVSEELQRRSDAWLMGETEVMADVVERTPPNRLHDLIVEEIAELTSKELPSQSSLHTPTAVFFSQFSPDGQIKLLAGNQTSEAQLTALTNSHITRKAPTDVRVPGYSEPFRVSSRLLSNGDRIFVGLSGEDRRAVTERLRWEFAVIWSVITLLGAWLVFVNTRRMLRRVLLMSDSAARIGSDDLGSRLPMTGRDDEISHLASTLNRMLDRVQNSVQELHTITESLAHDLRSPMTTIRGKLETALAEESQSKRDECVISAIEQMDRLSDMLTRSLDVAEANADSLKLQLEPMDLDATLRSLIEIYEPMLADHGLSIRLDSPGAVLISADHALMHRLMANLFDNEVRHLPSGSTVVLRLAHDEEKVRMILEDDGIGFPAEVLPRLFQRHAKGRRSGGYGLGLAFVAAVTRSHKGRISGENRREGGIRLTLEFPACNVAQTEPA